MDEDSGNLQLIEKARLGYPESISELAQIAEPRLYAYIYRLTLDEDVARDLTQESLLKMVESIGEIEKAQAFWAWLFRTALGRVQHHFRDRREHRLHMRELSKERASRLFSGQRTDGLSEAMRSELSEAIWVAISRLRLTYRNVLILRCFERLSYAQIGEVMQCKELRARVLVFRARRSLAQRLQRRGFGKPLLLTGLGLFGLMTAPTKAASGVSTVTAASLDVGPLATLVGVVSGRFIIPAAGAIAAVALGVTLESFIIGCAALAFVLICFTVGLYLD
jgi:RNA polymerase sigma factor (sigma-70 family)